MIDTIVLMLKQDMFTILEHDNFSPSTKGIYDPTNYYRLGGRSNITCKQNPTTLELRNGVYKPRLTVTKRMNKYNEFEVTLKIEFSVPKLLFGNNFDELEDSDFDEVIKILLQKLKEMGVYVYKDKLINAPVSAIHYGKNIVLTDYSTPYIYLKMLSKANINQHLDLNQTDFRNEGHSLKYRANSFEVVLYDKLRDLDKAKISEKRAEETDSAMQLDLFSTIQTKKPFEVLRMEVRLNKRQKLIQILKKVEIKSSPTFRTLFQTTTAQKVLLYYLDEIQSSYPSLLLLDSTKPKDVLLEIMIQNPEMSLRKAVQIVGLHGLLKDVGVRELREIIKRYGKNAWYLLNKEIEKLNYEKTTNPFTVLKKALTEFKPLKLVDFKDKMINNVNHV